MKKTIAGLVLGLMAGGCTTIQHADHVMVTDRPIAVEMAPGYYVMPAPLVGQTVYPHDTAASAITAPPGYSVVAPYATPAGRAYSYSGYGYYSAPVYQR